MRVVTEIDAVVQREKQGVGISAIFMNLMC